MDKRVGGVLALAVFVLVGCTSGHRSPGPPQAPAVPPADPGAATSAAAPSLRDWRPPAEGAVVPWQSLPDQVREGITQFGQRSPDGRWLAAKIASGGRLPEVWLAATDGTQARLVQQGLSGYGDGLWSPFGHYLYWTSPDDSWREVDPATGEVKLFLPDLLKGHKAGNLRFSPDGQQLLYMTGLCYCNRPGPGPLTTYVVRVDGTDLHEVDEGQK